MRKCKNCGGSGKVAGAGPVPWSCEPCYGTGHDRQQHTRMVESIQGIIDEEGNCEECGTYQFEDEEPGDHSPTCKAGIILELLCEHAGAIK